MQGSQPLSQHSDGLGAIGACGSGSCSAEGVSLNAIYKLSVLLMLRVNGEQTASARIAVMTYQVLARKWRPKSFSTLVGQEHVIKALSNALDQQRLHHAYLLTGTRGVGKTTIARLLAKSLNCETGVTAQPCGVCTACVQIDAGRFVDLLEIDAASNTGIDNIREVLDNAQYAPTQGRFKVYIIDEVHMLSKSAFNAMLKTLEEPPGHVKFILATTDPQKVPVTILSRCLQFSLRQMLPHQVTAHLTHVLDAEQIPYEPGALTLLGHAASGSMRDALSLLDQAIAYGSGRVEESGVRAMLGAVDQSYLFELLNHLARKDGPALMAAAENLGTRGVGADAALQELASVLHRLAMQLSVPSAMPADHPHAAALIELAAQLDPEEVQLYYQIALHGRRDLALAPDEFAGLSMTLLRMLAFSPEQRAPRTTVQSGNPPTQSITPAPAATVATAQASTRSAEVAAPTAQQPATAAAEAALIKEASPSPAPAPAPAPASSVPQHDERTPPPPEAEFTTPDAPPYSPPPWEDAVEEVAAVREFDGNWSALVLALRLGGQAGMLAQHAELVGHDGLVFDLAVPDAHKVVAGPDYRERLTQALSQHFGQPATIRITVGGAVEATPVAQQQRVREAGIAAATASLNADPFVQTLISDFGATVLPDSIQPRTTP